MGAHTINFFIFILFLFFVLTSIGKTKKTYHMSIDVEYSVDPSSTSGGRYLQKTTDHTFIFYVVKFRTCLLKHASRN